MAKTLKILKPVSPADLRLKSLLSRGYFPNELPPPFTTESFGANSAKFASSWDEEKIRTKFWTKPEHYTVPRYGHARRMLTIVNPVNQLQVAKIISNNWSDISERLKKSTITEFKPEIRLTGNGRSVTGVDFDSVARRRAHILASYGRYVKTDIARFYPSVYTHAVAWCIVGKEKAKATFNTKEFKQSYGNLLDKAIGAGQQGQTIGIPIGPDTSRIVSELIAAEVECLTKEQIPDLEERAVRYVDDMIIGLKETETASAVLSGLSSALYEYELELNAEKTAMHGIGCDHAPEWINYIRNFDLSLKKGRQRDDLDSYFEQALYLADANPRENVMLFAAKRAAGFQPDKTNRPHLVRWLLYAARRSPSCLRFVAEYLAALHDEEILPKGEIEAFILQQVPGKAEAAHTDEVAWLLFWAREIGLKVPVGAFDKVRMLRSSVVGLISLDLRQKGLVEGSLKVPEWKAFATSEGLKSEMWLLAYEASKKEWWPGSNKSSFLSAHPYFGDVLKKNVEFYDAKKVSKNAFEPIFPAVISPVGLSSGSTGYPT